MQRPLKKLVLLLDYSKDFVVSHDLKIFELFFYVILCLKNVSYCDFVYQTVLNIIP